jgi:hypothetical protein
MKRWGLGLGLVGTLFVATCAAEGAVPDDTAPPQAVEPVPAGVARPTCAEQPNKGACYNCCDRQTEAGFAPFDRAVADCRARGGRTDACATEALAVCEGIATCAAALDCAVASVCRDKP